MRKSRWVSFVVVIVLLTSPACTPGSDDGTTGVSITITSPPSGSSAAVGESVEIVSMAAADDGVARVDLLVNGQVVRSDTPPSGNPTTFSIIQTWTPVAQGEVTISVVAYDIAGADSDPAAIRIQVGEGAGGGDGGDGGVTVAEATPTPVPDVEVESGCSLNASYVADVTIPDDTVLAPGAAYVKTWRLRNSGTCDWGDGFNLVFVSDAQMGGPASVPVPAVAAGSTVDVNVDLVAPTTPGTYRGNWRMRSDEGLLFGTTVYVRIIVPEPATATPEPTEPPTAAPTGAPTTPPTLAPTVPPMITLMPPMITFVIPPGLLIPLVTVQQVYEQVWVGAGTNGYVTAECPADTIVVSGGFAANSDMFVYTHYMYGNGWRVYGRNTSGSNILLNAYAMCLSASSGSVNQVYAQESAPGGGIGHAVASCPAGSVVTGGGWATNSGMTMEVYNSSMTGNGWQVYARNSSGSSELVNSYAICLSDLSGTTTQTYVQGSIAGNTSSGVVAACGSGILVGGGFAGSNGLTIYNSSRRANSTTEWNVYAYNTTSSNKTLNTYVICLTLQ